MLKIYSDTKIYALCPSQYATGGPEAIHQLVDKLRKLGHDASIVYIPHVENPTPESFKKYNIGIARNVEDRPENLLIAPEGWISKLSPYQKIQKAIWWLSVDNAEKNTTQIGTKVNARWKNLKKIKFVFNAYKFINRRGKNVFDFKSEKNRGVIHFAQSVYAQTFLNNHLAGEIYSLSDYLGEEYAKPFKQRKREDIVLYNPKKGEEITSKLIKAAPDIKWTPLQNMTPRQVAELMEKSKVYIDFGEHPGKDRIPREAAMKGCCIIAGLKGSARFFQDMPIDQSYKFEVNPLDVVRIIDKIKECLERYEGKTGDFDNYRRKILMNEEVFEEEVWDIFGAKSK